ncbi:hypothetical protein HG66A1_20540 [Gimesia chilikensis]|uniref:Uncharacterized protein n=1 Tax=Gimesia chilikensis TaxID=2605989 RepID=A0A517PLL7_9PLAN|nr:hypothetical protein HG66A1_20540 [Gimesia chilikensis]
MKRQRNAVAENRSAEQELFPETEGEAWIHNGYTGHEHSDKT